MTWDRIPIVEQRLDTYLAGAEPVAERLAPDATLPGTTLTAAAAVGLFEDQLTSRQIDVAARELKKSGRSFYTISSAGHEDNAVIGAQLRADDPAFLHYRSGGFVMARARQLAGSTPTLDTLLGIVASSEDPIAQGRHKVWGSRALWIPPQTSTIASHLPKAMGLAFSLARAKRIGVGIDLPEDAVVVCSFGDASANHATALAAINTARYAVRMGLPMLPFGGAQPQILQFQVASNHLMPSPNGAPPPGVGGVGRSPRMMRAVVCHGQAVSLR